MIALREASGVSNVGAIVLREAAGVVDVGEVYLREASGLAEIYSAAGGGSDAFTVDVPPNAYGYGNSMSPVSVTTEIVTATPTGGTGPFNYLWSGSGSPWTITNPTSPSTAFRAAAVPPADSVVGSFSCAVTDANGNVVNSGAVSAEASNFGGYA